MRRSLLAAAAAAALALSGCGGAGPGAAQGTAQGTGGAPIGASEREARFLSVVSGAARLLSGGGLRADPLGSALEIPGGFSEQAIAAEPSAYRLVQINALGLNELGRIVQANGAETTLALQSGPTAAFDAGVLTATRGFGDDLLTIDAPGLPAILRAGGGTLTRTAETLDSQDQVVSARYACTVTAAGRETVNLGLREATLRRLDENCRGERLVFDNIYWLDDSGEIVASRQYVSPTVAYLRANRL